MKNIMTTLLLLILASCTPGQSFYSAPGSVDEDIAVPNQILVKGNKAVIENELKSMGISFEISTINAGLNMYQINHSGKVKYGKIANALVDKVDVIEQDSKVTLNAIERKSEWPEDSYYFYQWAMNNIGQNAPGGLAGKINADMKVTSALKKYEGQLTDDIVIAVIDSGVDYKHKDLNANMWVNTKESQKENGVAGEDDDGNGYCDDVHGYDFTSSGQMAPFCGKKGRPDPIDKGGHGTHCAGNIAAIHNNNMGVAGVNPKAKIMALKALGGAGGGWGEISKAITYAIDNKAHIISASFGGKGKSELAKELIAEAGRNGILFVVAAGNDGANMEIESQRTYPASYDLPNILTVAASDNMDNPAIFTNYGHNFVDVFAPGVGIVSTYLEQSYTIMDGTSMATPLVAGVASLLMSAHPALIGQPAKVKEILMATVDRVPSMYGKVLSNGRINAEKALDAGASASLADTPVLAWQEAPHSVSEMGYKTELVDIRHTIEQPGAKAIRVHFDFIELDRQFDSLYIYDKNFKLITEVQNGVTRDLWSPVILGDKVILRFVNAKVRKKESPMNVTLSANEQKKCLESGGRISGVETTMDPLAPTSGIVCEQSNIEYVYEDLQKDIDDSDVFFSWKSEGFSVDKIEFTENAI